MNTPSFAMMYHSLTDSQAYGNNAITYPQFTGILDYLNNEHNVLSASKFLERLNDAAHSSNSVTLTFDDGMRCHWDLAVPWLEAHGLSGIFFIHSQPLVDGYDKLLSIRQFALEFFSCVDEYYGNFEFTLKSTYPLIDLGEIPSEFLKQYTFYSNEDRRYRYIRDFVLSDIQFYTVLEKMMCERNTCYQDFCNSELWLSPNQIRKMSEMGHVIGLHTHTHPTNITRQTYNDQLDEFRTNKEILERIIGKPVTTASYPCGRFNDNTVSVLKLLGIKSAFGSSMNTFEHGDNFSIPREDPSNLASLLDSRTK